MVRLIENDGEIETAPSLPRMTEEEFVAWCDEDTHAEWVNGEVQLMSPVSVRHGEVHKFLLRLICDFLDEHPLGALHFEPVHVRLNPALRRSPDLIYVANARMEIVKDQVIDGAPDLVVEIVSPGSVSRDYRDKYQEYEAAGVREYWIVDPGQDSMELNRLVEGKYRTVDPVEGRLHSSVLEGFYVRPLWLGARPLPRVKDCLAEILGPAT